MFFYLKDSPVQSPSKRLEIPKKKNWSEEEDKALKYFLMDQSEDETSWPSYRSSHLFWSEAATYICNMSGTSLTRSGWYF